MSAEIFHLGPIEDPSEDQVHHFLAYASFLDDVALRGGMTAEEASLARRQTLARIGMGRLIEPPEPRPLYESREDPW